MEGWISLAAAGDAATVAIYTNDGGNLPGSELYPATFLAQNLNGDISIPDREGASGLDWTLGAGTYWAVFRQDAGQDQPMAMPQPAQNPLAKYAFYSTFNGSWAQSAGGLVGIRLEGTLATPLPAAAWLFLSGLAGLAALSRRRKAA